ncbi:hypothetical protein HZS_7436, partial [Henneguya salminicola]
WLYSCCNKSREEPCYRQDSHVSYTEEMLKNFKFTENWTNPNANKIVAMDCEGVYTKIGLELTRIVLIDVNFNVILDLTVKPKYELLNYLNL